MGACAYPLGHNSGIGHVISILAGDLIFDSTQIQAFKFSKEALGFSTASSWLYVLPFGNKSFLNVYFHESKRVMRWYDHFSTHINIKNFLSYF
jgi:hypothetical protein